MKQATTILIVEDNVDIREGICDLLQFLPDRYNLTCLSADNGLTGLAIMADTIPDLIISDIMMPQMDGIEFVERVRQQPATIDTPFIFLTARTAEEDILSGRLKGANLYLVKPFSGQELLELVDSQLQRSFQLRQKRQQEKYKLQETILKLLSHEFRTPLTYVTAFHDLLQDGLDNYLAEEDFRSYLYVIQVGCQRLIRLVEGFIYVIELRTGDAESQFNEQAQLIDDLPQLLATAVTNCHKNTQLGTVNIHLLDNQKLPPIWGNRKDLITIFVHLLENAIKFTYLKNKEAGNVYLTASISEDEIAIAVADDGPGFPAKVKTEIFEPFFQHNRQYFEQQGAGIGLTITKSLTELHGGQLQAQSQEGKGSIFTTTFPIHNAAKGKADIQQPKQFEQIPATILIVEDDYDLLHGLKDFLQIVESRYQLNVHTAISATEALKILDQQTPHLIISDIKMPKIDGYQLLEIVRSNPDWLEIPFIFLTVLGDSGEAHRAWRSGVEEYISKPYKADQLFSLVVNQLDRYFQSKNLQARDFAALKRIILNILPSAMHSPLNSLNSYVAAISEGLDHAEDNETLKIYLEGVRESNLRFTKMVEEFMILVEQKTDASSKFFQSTARPITNTSLLLSQIHQQIQQAIKKNGTLTYKSTNELPPIFGLENQLEECLLRLVIIWLDCCPAQIVPTIHLSATSANDQVIIMLRLEAPLPVATAEIIDRILQKESAVALELASFAPSLRIAQGYIELHKGHLHFENKPAASFTLILPVYQPLLPQT